MSRKILAFYIRLSHEDDYKASGMANESFSITNQRELLYYELSKRNDLSEYEVREYVDDGYSETNFNRSSFQRMIDDVRKREIQCIMVKDFSRFARNFLDMGEYLEQIFPFLGIRFISVNDHYDSQNGETSASDWNVVFKNFLYDLYSKDLSQKIRAARRTKAKKGEFLTTPPLGYVRSKTVKNKLEIEPEGAKIVRKIFDAALAGKKIPEIVEMLNHEQIPTPGRLGERLRNGHWKHRYANETFDCWTYSSVYRIIRNLLYTGACVSGRRSQVNPCGTETKTNDRDDWIIVPDCHEAIVSEAEFETVQRECRITKPLAENRKKIFSNQRHALGGFVVCGYCSHRMVFERRITVPDIYFCRTTQHAKINISDKVCDTRKYKVEDLNDVVLNAIREMAKLAGKKMEDMAARSRVITKDAERTELRLVNLEQQSGKLKRAKQEAYENYVSEIIDKKRFLAEKAEYDKFLSALEAEVKLLKSQKEETRELDVEEKHLYSELTGYASAQELSRDMVETLIDQVVVYRDNRVEIKWKFRDIFQEM